jgi:valyl-tRNA synthetase
LVSISQLQRLKIGEILIRRDRAHPFRANLPDISEYSYWDCTEHNSGEENKAREDVCIFDIQEFVKKSKKEEVQFKLVARLDKKIAELEKEEKEEKEKAENEKNGKNEHAKRVNQSNEKGKKGSKKIPPSH